jgi:hypothetical protein
MSMVSVLKGAMAILGAMAAAMAVTIGLVFVIMLLMAGYIVIALLIPLVLLVPLAAPVVQVVAWLGSRRSEGAALVPTPTMPEPAFVAAQRPVEMNSVRSGGSSMRITRARFGIGEWFFLGATAVLIAAQVAAVIMGLGPIAAVVNLGYFLVFALMYWIYRHARESRIVHGEMPGAVAREPAALSADLSWEERVLKGVDIFKNLSDEQIAKVASLGATLDVPAGQSLGVAGEPGNQLFIIIRGMAELSAHSGVGEITVRIAGPGESFPLAALLGSGNLITSVEAMTDMQLIAIPRLRLLALFAEEPEIGMKIYEAVAEVLGNRYKSTLTHLTSSAEMALRDMGFFANV